MSTSFVYYNNIDDSLLDIYVNFDLDIVRFYNPSLGFLFFSIAEFSDFLNTGLITLAGIL